MKKLTQSPFTGEISEIWGKKKWKNLFCHTDISTLVLFRIVFGAIMLWEVTRYFSHGWIKKYWIDPHFHFTYWPFDFLEPLPGNGMYILFGVLGVLAFFIMIGFLYRISTVLFFLGFSYTFLLEQTRYLNHFYLVILLSFLIIFLPLNSSASVDAKIWKNIKSETAPLWCLWLMKFMIGVPYFFGGVAKLNYDWLHGQPLGLWLSNDTDLPLIGQFFTEKWMIMLMSYSGLLLDLFIVPALLFKRTRVIGFLFILSFHLMNSQIFTIGIFPWFMIGATTLYFSSSWPRKVYNALKTKKNQWLLTLDKNKLQVPEKLIGTQKVIITLLVAWFLIQTLVPLRHFLIPGNPNWTEEGHRYAWHMKLRTKRGIGQYEVYDKKTGEHIETIQPSDVLKSWQAKKMGGKPYLIHQFAQMLAKEYALHGFDVAIYPNVIATLNGRRYQNITNGTVDLVSEKRPVFPPAKWIIPLETPLEDQLENQ